MKTRQLLLVAVVMLHGCGNAAPIENARPGQTVRLSGNQGILTLRNKTWSPAVVVDATNATFTGIVLDRVSGIKFVGGTVIGPGGRSYAIRVSSSQNVEISGMTLTGAHRGVVVHGSQDLVLKDNKFTGIISDGIDIANSQRILVQRNTCTKFNPVLTTWDADGTKHDGDHPDCIQSWSRPGKPLTSNVKVIGNHVDGMMQGIFMADFDGLEIRDNILRTALGNAIAVGTGKNFIIRNNRVSTVAGAVHRRSGAAVRANIVVRSDATGLACGNVVSDVPNNPATKPC